MICAEIHSTSMVAEPTYLSSHSHVFHTYSFDVSNTSQDTSRFDCPAHPIYPSGHTEFIPLILFIWTPAQPMVIQTDAGSLFFSTLAEYLALPAHTVLEFGSDCRCKSCWELFEFFLSLLLQWLPVFLQNFLFSFLSTKETFQSAFSLLSIYQITFSISNSLFPFPFPLTFSLAIWVFTHG